MSSVTNAGLCPAPAGASGPRPASLKRWISKARLGRGAGAAPLLLLALLLPAAAHAAGCPPTQDGHRLARLDGASLYQADPGAGMLLAPTQENPGNRGVNIWSLPDPRGIVLVCRYEGVAAPIVTPLPPDVRSCRQDLRTGTFECR